MEKYGTDESLVEQGVCPYCGHKLQKISNYETQCSSCRTTFEIPLGTDRYENKEK